MKMCIFGPLLLAFFTPTGCKKASNCPGEKPNVHEITKCDWIVESNEFIIDFTRPSCMVPREGSNAGEYERVWIFDSPDKSMTVTVGGFYFIPEKIRSMYDGSLEAIKHDLSRNPSFICEKVDDTRILSYNLTTVNGRLETGSYFALDKLSSGNSVKWIVIEFSPDSKNDAERVKQSWLGNASKID